MNEASKLGEQPLGKLIFSMCTHASLALLLYSIYSLTDTIIIAWGVNSYAAGAVSVTSPLLMLLGAFSTTVGAGGSSLVSRALGKMDTTYAASITGTVFVSFWGLAILISILGLIFLDPLLQILGATGALYPYAKEYATIILAGAVTSTAFSSLIRAEGAAKFGLFIWLIPIAVNIVLDVFFVFWFEMGVSGAALATVCAQIVSVCMSIWFFFFRSRRAYRIHKEQLRFHPRILSEVASIGFPSLISQISASVLVVILNRFLGATGGETAITAFSFAIRIQALLLLPQSGIAQGVQPIIGYSYSSKNMNRARATVKIAALSSAIYGVVITAIGILVRRPLMMLFTNDEEIVSLGGIILLFLLITIPVKGFSPVVATYFQSIGDKRRSLLIPTVGFFIIQVPIVLIMGNLYAFGGMLWALVLTEILIFVFALFLRKGIVV